MRVIVVVAGIAGLGAAYRLREATVFHVKPHEAIHPNAGRSWRWR